MHFQHVTHTDTHTVEYLNLRPKSPSNTNSYSLKPAGRQLWPLNTYTQVKMHDSYGLLCTPYMMVGTRTYIHAYGDVKNIHEKT